jgi:hypothetical protein
MVATAMVATAMEARRNKEEEWVRDWRRHVTIRHTCEGLTYCGDGRTMTALEDKRKVQEER